MSWPLVPISELCELAIDCVNKTAPVVPYETPYKMIRTTNIKGGFINTKDVRYVTKETFDKWTRRSRPRFGDVILTREAPVGEVGRCTFSDEEYIFLGQRLFQYRPDPNKLDWNFLAYVLQSPEVQGRLHGHSFGATVPHVKVGDAENLHIPCPTLQEQKRIGSALAAYDDLIENNRRRIELLEEAARRLYREWFVHLRFPGHEDVKVVDGKPVGWERKPLSSVVKVNERNIGSKERPDEVLYIDISSVSPGVIQEVTRYDFADAPGRARRRVAHGDVIWSCVRPNRRSYALVWEPDEKLVASTGFAVLTAKAVPFSYLYFATTTDAFVAHLEANATGATYPAVTAKTFEDVEMLVPDEETLNGFSEVVLPQLEQIEMLKRQNKLLAKARDALLPKLMSGQLDVSGIPMPELEAA
ncbi:restriction endonuclease subunit S [Burkholderia cepacia]|uniref:restriction endonuclease subunit S n=1 Tax=Burkholderia cepacia TaxID=292 RepID=UPI0009BF208A|nr:restriction endonuclease subunit S [Burkholderia cepacia]